MDYVANSEQDYQQMLKFMDVDSLETLLEDVPKEIRNFTYNIAPGLSEPDILSFFSNLSEKNSNVYQYDSFLGAGSYHHYVPAIVTQLISRGDFATAYTPYQPEASQGTLQAIFEFQSLMSRLTGMDVANASLYEGASSVSEAALMSIRVQGKSNRIIVSETVHPEYRTVLETYLKHTGEVFTVPRQGFSTQLDTLERILEAGAASVIVQYPNFFGCLEDIQEIEKLTHAKGALLIMVVNPIALGLVKTPGEWGADICVGEGQSLGNSISYGGPYFGFIASKKSYVRKMPGRIAGMTQDHEGKRGYVLTLQAREQHIRREKATSNICTNQALNALAGAIFLTALGKSGIQKMASLNFKKAHYMASILSKIDGCSVIFDHPFFNEFILKTPIDSKELSNRMLSQKIFAGLPLGNFYDDLQHALLVCVTEMMSKEKIDRYVGILKEQVEKIGKTTVNH